MTKMITNSTKTDNPMIATDTTSRKRAAPSVWGEQSTPVSKKLKPSSSTQDEHASGPSHTNSSRPLPRPVADMSNYEIPVATIRNQPKIPMWHPSYEEPLQKKFPLHFDHYAVLQDIAGTEDHPEHEKFQALLHDFKALQTTIQASTNAFVTLRYVDAVSGPAMKRGIASWSPPFFAVTTYEEGGDGEPPSARPKIDVREIEDDVYAIIEEHFPPEEDEEGVVLRWFKGCYDSLFVQEGDAT